MFITSYRLYIIIESISLVIIIRVFIKYLSRLLASIYNLCVATLLPLQKKETKKSANQQTGPLARLAKESWLV